MIAATLVLLFASCQPQKYLVVDLEDQKIYRFEADQLIDSSRVCTGRGWHNIKTKRQRYRASYLISAKQGANARSSIPGKYNLKTPYKFILSPTVSRHGERMHGFAKVPRHPASHGCIRLPLSYAKKIHPWVEPGKTKLFVRLQFQTSQKELSMNESLSETIARIVKQALREHPNSIFAPQAFQMTVQNQLAKTIDQVLADLVQDGQIRNLDCSGDPKRAVYCLAAEHGGNEAATRQFFEEIVRITGRV